MNRRAYLIRMIKDRLSIYAVRVDMDKGKESAAAESLYCELLNRLLGYHLKNKNLEKPNFPAIDLGDESPDVRLGVQVTSSTTREKVQNTLDTFFDHGLEQTYTRLVMLIVGKWTESKKEFRLNGKLDFDPKRDIWDTDQLVGMVEAVESLDHLERIAEFLDRNLDICPWEREPLLDLANCTVKRPKDFIGREVESSRIERDLTRDGVAFLSGLGGIGKTELAQSYGADYHVPGWRMAYFVRFKESFERTMLDNIAPFILGFKRDSMTEAQILEEAMRRLYRSNPTDLLILDNVEEFSSFEEMERDSVFEKLCAMPMKLIVTTRLHVRGGIELMPLSNPELYQLFDKHELQLPVETMDALISAVNAHTMTVDLMARTMYESWEQVTADMILKAMANTTLREADYPKVFTDHNKDPQQRKIYAHLSSLFNLTNIPEDGKQALRCATLLPQEGMDPALFLRGLPEGPKEAIKLLAKQGWVRRENQLLTIHPVVRMVCKAELKPTEQTCWSFVKGVWSWYDQKDYDHGKIRQLAQLLDNAAETLEDPDGWYIGQAGFLWNILADFPQAQRCNRKAVELLELRQPGSLNLATAYNNLGTTFGELGSHDEAQVYQLKALDICIEVLPPEHPFLAVSYNKVGMTYGALDDHDKALDYHLKAMAIQEKVLPPEPLSLATTYNNVGKTYGALGDHDSALVYHQNALAIRTKLLRNAHPDLALSYNNIGMTYSALGDHTKALKSLLAALAIQHKKLPENHPRNAACCSNIAWTYQKMGNYESALDYMRQAVKIAEKALPPGHRSRVNYSSRVQELEEELRLRQVSDTDSK